LTPERIDCAPAFLTLATIGMPPSGPQQFDLNLFETFDTKDPAAPQGGLNIQGQVGVTVNWNIAGTELTDKGVEYDAPLWLGPGCGPFTIFEEVLNQQPRPVGSVVWSVVTRTYKSVKQDPPNKRYRWSVTPVATLIRTVTSTQGKPPEITQVMSAKPDPIDGNWLPLP
jgi:hypothetical protein